jgi:hypothetical protein
MRLTHRATVSLPALMIEATSAGVNWCERDRDDVRLTTMLAS